MPTGTRKTQETKIGPTKTIRDRVIEKFDLAEKTRRELLRQAMKEATFAEHFGYLEPVEGSVLGLTGSFEEVKQFEALRKRIEKAGGQALVAANRKEAHAGIINGPLQAETMVDRDDYLGVEQPIGFLAVQLTNVYSWYGPTGWRHSQLRQGPKNHRLNLVEIRGDSENHKDSYYTPDKPVDYSIKRPFEDREGVLVVGHDELLKPDSKALKGIPRELLLKLYQDLSPKSE